MRIGSKRKRVSSFNIVHSRQSDTCIGNQVPSGTGHVTGFVVQGTRPGYHPEGLGAVRHGSGDFGGSRHRRVLRWPDVWVPPRLHMGSSVGVKVERNHPESGQVNGVLDGRETTVRCCLLMGDGGLSVYPELSRGCSSVFRFAPSTVG